jgi:lipooligosaccharide transport system permease protein
LTAPSVRIAGAHARAYRRTWQTSVWTAFLSPALFLGAIGLGLGTLVDDSTTGPLEGLSYVEFLAPGLLAATAVQIAGSEGTFPVMAGTTWTRTYYAMLATPLSAVDIAIGHLVWVATRIVISCSAILAVVAAFGATSTPAAVLAIPAAVLTGLAIAGPGAAYSVGLRSGGGLAGFNRFVIMPLFLFSGTFFPVSQLPGWAQGLAWVVPPWHGVELCRGLMTDRLDGGRALLHVAYLVAWVVAGAWLAAARFRKRLVV